MTVNDTDLIEQFGKNHNNFIALGRALVHALIAIAEELREHNDRERYGLDRAVMEKIAEQLMANGIATHSKEKYQMILDILRAQEDK